MDTTNKMNASEKDTLELVLEEYTQEQAHNAKAINDLVSAVNGLTSKLNSFEEKLEKPKQIAVSTDTKPLQDMVKKGIMDIKLLVAAQPKNVIRKFQILLFPEQDAKLFYRVVFGRWFLWLAFMLLTTDLYKWGIYYSNNQKEIRQVQLENDRIKKAWQSLYYGQGKSLKRLMDSAYFRNSN